MLQVEREFKNLLTKSQYHSLLEDFKPLLTKEITQTNSYYDWDGILQSHKMALRIRIVEGKTIGEITLKIPQSSLEVLEFTHEMPVEILHQYNEQKEFSLPLPIKEALESNGVFRICINSNKSSKKIFRISSSGIIFSPPIIRG